MASTPPTAEEAQPELDPQFFRHQSGRMVVALTRLFGMHNLALAEDVVQDAFCRAIEVWKFKGVPRNPSAWLMATAKNRAVDILRRERTARTYAPELTRWLESEWTLVPTVEESFAAHAIKDDELRMMFSCCHPRLPEPVQVALILNILCGFSVHEVASAFLTSRAAMEKRIARGKKTLAASKRLFEFASSDLTPRLDAVHRALYLLFNEGYHGASEASAVRTELCREAMRLTALLLAHPVAATPATHALGALMSLNAARLPTRLDAAGNLQLLAEQDRTRWDPALIGEGQHLLNLAATGTQLTEYHVEAAIAFLHTSAPSNDATDWRAIVALYDTLLTLRASPVVALNRAIAVAQHLGPERGLEEIAAIPDPARLHSYPFYFAALGELELKSGNPAAARAHLQRALELARNPAERHSLARRVKACDLTQSDPAVDNQPKSR
jgi:RNA polymerase sigma-70 factor (ECF subfamily)